MWVCEWHVHIHGVSAGTHFSHVHVVVTWVPLIVGHVGIATFR